MTFRERLRPSWWWPPVFLVGMTLACRALSIGEGWAQHVGYALLPTAFIVVTASLTVLQVRDGHIVTSRRAGGRHLPVDDIVDHRVLTGPALREVRNRLTPSFRLHCPVWYRLGVQVITRDGDGDGRVEHLYGVRDASGFLRAIGASDGSVTHHHDRGVPV